MQSVEGVDACRSPRREVAREQRDRGEKKRNDAVRRDVSRIDTEEKRGVAAGGHADAEQVAILVLLRLGWRQLFAYRPQDAAHDPSRGGRQTAKIGIRYRWRSDDQRPGMRKHPRLLGAAKARARRWRLAIELAVQRGLELVLVEKGHVAGHVQCSAFGDA